MTEPAQLRLELMGSRQLPNWLAESGVSLAFTTYQVGKLFLIGLQPDGRLSIFERTFNRAMGLGVADGQLWLATLFQLWRFDDVLDGEPASGAYAGNDRLFVPTQAWTTGDLDIHDVAVLPDGRPIFVNTLFSCLATTEPGYSFKAVWRPRFVTRLAAEDRCHLNGLAMRGGKPAYVTAVSSSDVADGWRDRRVDGGLLIDVASGETIAAGFSMPHSPRWHEGRLWLLDSGHGQLGWVDLATGRFEPVCFLPGYGRGLAMHGRFAIVGLSKPRGSETLTGLPLDEELCKRDAEPRCGLLVVDLATGDAVHWLRIAGIVEELYDVAVLPGVHRPALLGLKTDEACRMIRVAPEATPAPAAVPARAAAGPAPDVGTPPSRS